MKQRESNFHGTCGCLQFWDNVVCSRKISCRFRYRNLISIRLPIPSGAIRNFCKVRFEEFMDRPFIYVTKSSLDFCHFRIQLSDFSKVSQFSMNIKSPRKIRSATSSSFEFSATSDLPASRKTSVPGNRDYDSI